MRGPSMQNGILPSGAPRATRAGKSTIGLATVFWLALATLLAALGMKALEACGIGWGEGRPAISFCPAPAAPDPRIPALRDARAHERDLQTRLNRLRLALAEAPACPPPVAEAPPPEPPPPEPIAEAPPPPPIQPPMPRERPTPPPEPEPPPTPLQQPEAPPARQPDIPRQAWENRDVGFLDGCWTLISPQTVQDIGSGFRQGIRDWRICFDRSGAGRQSMTIADGDSCSGGVQARFLPDGRLSLIGTGDMPCRRGRIPRIVQECQRRSDGTAHCIGSQPSARARNIPSIFRR